MIRDLTGSLVMAVLLWTFLYRQGKQEVDVTVPLTISYPKTEIARILVRDSNGNPIDRIRIRAQGARADVGTLSDLSLGCHVILPEDTFDQPRQGRLSLRLNDSNLTNLPAHVTVQFLPSAVLTIEYWRFVVSTVPVRPGELSDAPEGYEVKQVRIEPKEVQVRVPVDAPLPPALALPRIDLTGQRSSFQRSLRPVAPEGVELVTPEVTVYVEIAPKPVERESRLKLRVLVPGEIPYAWSLTVDEARVRLKGVPEDLDRVNNGNSFAFVVLRQTEIPTPDQVGPTGYQRTLTEFGFTTTAEGLVGRVDVELIDEVRILFKKR